MAGISGNKVPPSVEQLKAQIKERMKKEEEDLKYRIDHTQKRKVENSVVYRIVALKNFADVKEGDVGGWVGSTLNLSQVGKCWIYDDAVSYQGAKLHSDAALWDTAVLKGDAWLDYTIIVKDKAIISASLNSSILSVYSGDALITSPRDVWIQDRPKGFSNIFYSWPTQRGEREWRTLGSRYQSTLNGIIVQDEENRDEFVFSFDEMVVGNLLLEPRRPFGSKLLKEEPHNLGKPFMEWT